MFFIYHPRAKVRKIARELGISALFPRHMHRNIARKNKLSVIVNWGCSSEITGTAVPVLNRDISGSVRKIRTFELLEAAELPVARWTLDAASALSDDPRPFYERGRYLGRKDGLTGGAGITIYEKGQQPTEKHEFYTQVIAKAAEVRIHVAGGNVICEQIKFVPAGSKVLIRNFHNGARFSARNIGVEVGTENAAQARQIAIRAAAACGLDFGALDMALTKDGRWIIFEINSAPGLMLREEDGTEHDVVSTYEAYRTYFAGFKE